jgi:hypothetical protein
MKHRKLQSLLHVALMGGLASVTLATPVHLSRHIVNFVLRDACSTGCSNDQLATYRRSIKFETHDINADGVPEFFVYIEHRDLCGASFNCEYWVFQRRHKRYRMIAGGYPVIRIARTVTNGFKDLESQGYMGGCTRPDGSWGREIYLTTFKFNGEKYLPTEIGERCRAR